MQVLGGVQPRLGSGVQFVKNLKKIGLFVEPEEPPDSLMFSRINIEAAAIYFHMEVIMAATGTKALLTATTGTADIMMGKAANTMIAVAQVDAKMTKKYEDAVVNNI